MHAEYDDLMRLLTPHGQEHLLRWWPELDDAQRACLAEQVRAVDWSTLARARDEALAAVGPIDLPIHPAPVRRLAASFEEWEQEQAAAETGQDLLREGSVAVLLVAGGQGTRLGHPGPKGAYPIGPVTQRTLFQIHAEKVLALGRRYETSLPLCIMTSPDNDAQTRRFFEEHRYFGLEPEQVHFFVQGTLPAVDAASGKALLASRHELALSPNGHGGVVEALTQSRLLARLEKQGVKHLFYFQVDNPLVKIADPAFLGLHVQAGAELSLKVLPKLSPEERLGVVVEVGEKLRVIEYSDLPAELASKRNERGELELWAGSIAIHVFDTAFLKRLAESSALPFHRAHKVVPHLDHAGCLSQPEKPHALKFERFVFDALPLARKALVIETSRREEFEPLKNARGENSPGTVRQAMSNLYADWLEAAGVTVPRHADGSSRFPIEISPLFALDAEELRGKPLNLEAVEGPLVLE